MAADELCLSQSKIHVLLVHVYTSKKHPAPPGTCEDSGVTCTCLERCTGNKPFLTCEETAASLMYARAGGRCV